MSELINDCAFVGAPPEDRSGGVARLVLERELGGAEIIHFAEEDLLISSRHRTVTVKAGAREQRIVLPEAPHHRVAGAFRTARRALRLDKANVVPVGPDRSGLVILRRGQMFHYDLTTSTLTKTLEVYHCRNVLHGAVTVLDGDEIVFGEYGPSGAVNSVPIYRSTDAGRSWSCVYEFAPGEVRHIHGCYWDSWEQRYWVFTGDSDEEVQVLSADRSFADVKRVGGGSQHWRACTVLFEEKHVYWIMDSERQDSHLIRFDRETRKIDVGQMFPGPVWYTKKMTDGVCLAATTCEIGAGVHDDYAHVYISSDLERWDEVARFRWDGLPKSWFKFGVVCFAEGAQSSRSFYMFGEALKRLDGRSFQCSIARQP